MSGAVYVHMLSVLGWWPLAWRWLRHSATPIPRQWLPYLCFKNPPQGGKLADSGLSWLKFPPQSSYTQYWDSRAWPSAPGAVYFSITSGLFSGKRLLLVYSFQSLSASIHSPGARGCEIAATAMSVTRRTDLPAQPRASLILPTSFSGSSNPLSSHSSLRMAGRDVHNFFISKQRSDWNVIVPSLWLLSQFFSACN